MTRVDQFESVFRAAARTIFHAEEVDIASVMIVSDQPPDDASDFGEHVRAFLGALDASENIKWTTVHGGDFDTVPDLLELIERERPGLVCTYRHLHSDSWRWPYTLGEYVDVLTQATTTPVLVMPHPKRPELRALTGRRTKAVMAVTGHLTGDNRLVSYAARFTEHGGTLLLGHVENSHVFERYMEAISKIATIDTAPAREEIQARLLKDPTDFIESCRESLAVSAPSLSVESIVTRGHHIRQYRGLIEEREVDLLVMNTKDDDQLAMHGLAYPLAVELRSIPLLML
jgi:hypothetical protein